MAAGQSQRMAGLDKIFANVMDSPLIAYAVDALESSLSVNAIVLVLPSDRVEAGWDLARQRGWRKLVSVCAGGERRQDSVRHGLEHLGPCDWVVIHDGARPCLEPDLVDRGLKAARETGAAVAALPMKDTIKVVSPAGVVESTPDRQTLWGVQTPQVFRYELLKAAHREWTETVTDDAAMVEALGHKVKVYMGSPINLKVTTPEDLYAIEGFLRARVALQRP